MFEHVAGVTTFRNDLVDDTGKAVIAAGVKMQEGLWIINHEAGEDMLWGQASGSEEVLLPKRGSNVQYQYIFIPIKNGPFWVKSTNVGPFSVSGFYY